MGSYGTPLLAPLYLYEQVLHMWTRSSTATVMRDGGLWVTPVGSTVPIWASSSQVNKSANVKRDGGLWDTHIGSTVPIWEISSQVNKSANVKRDGGLWDTPIGSTVPRWATSSQVNKIKYCKCQERFHIDFVSALLSAVHMDEMVPNSWLTCWCFKSNIHTENKMRLWLTNNRER